MGITNLLPSLESSIGHKVKFNGARHYMVPTDADRKRKTKKAHEHERTPARKRSRTDYVDDAQPGKLATNKYKSPLSMSQLLQHMKRGRNKDGKRKNISTSTIADAGRNAERRTRTHSEDTDKDEEDLDSMRHLRIGIDISTWIAAACHGNGAELIDERHFSRHGRHELEMATSTGTGTGTSTSGANSTSMQQTNINIQQIREQAQNFIKVATHSVIRKIKSIQYLLSPEVIIVLDGASPPIKKNVVEERQKSRNEAARKRDAQVNENEGTLRTKNPNSSEANLTADQREDIANNRKISHAKKAGAHTSEMYAAVVRSILTILREHEITFLVSPYEADGQLTYLSRNKYIDFIVSEDSDFIPCGAEAVLYKYRADIPFTAGFDGFGEGDTGAGKHAKKYSKEAFAGATATATLILRDHLGASTSTSFSLLGFTDVMMCIVAVAAGCDYAQSLKGIGLVHARNSVSDAFEDDATFTLQGSKLEKVWKGLFARCHGNLSQEEKRIYKDNFIKALVMFRHPVVFDPVSVKCIIANIDTPDEVLMEYGPYADLVNCKRSIQDVVGDVFDTKMAIHIAEGWVNPKISDLRYEEQETPQHVITHLLRWKDEEAQRKFQIECDRMNASQSQSQRSRGSVVGFTSPTPPSATKSSRNPSQSTAGTSSASKPSTQGSHQSNLSVDIMSPNLLA